MRRLHEVHAVVVPEFDANGGGRCQSRNPVEGTSCTLFPILSARTRRGAGKTRNNKVNWFQAGKWATKCSYVYECVSVPERYAYPAAQARSGLLLKLNEMIDVR
jgi:hypothetical protein